MQSNGEDAAAAEVVLKRAISVLDMVTGLTAGREHGNVLVREGRYREAEAAYTACLASSTSSEQSSERIALLCNRAHVRLQLRQWEAALDDARACLKMQPG